MTDTASEYRKGIKHSWYVSILINIAFWTGVILGVLAGKEELETDSGGGSEDG